MALGTPDFSCQLGMGVRHGALAAARWDMGTALWCSATSAPPQAVPRHLPECGTEGLTVDRSKWAAAES